MKKHTTIFFRIAIVMMGLCALVFLLLEPHLEGRNLHSSVFEIYFKDPFLAYVYFASIPFFIALYQGVKIFKVEGEKKVLSEPDLQYLRTIKFCMMALIGFAAVGEVFIFLSPSDDRAGGVFMGALAVLGSVVIYVLAGMVERKYRGQRLSEKKK